MKNVDSSLREYVRRLSDEDLRFLYDRFSANLSGDRPQILDLLATNKEADRWLSTAADSTDFFERLDVIGDLITKEHLRRSGRFEEAAAVAN